MAAVGDRFLKVYSYRKVLEIVVQLRCSFIQSIYWYGSVALFVADVTRDCYKYVESVSIIKKQGEGYGVMSKCKKTCPVLSDLSVRYLGRYLYLLVIQNHALKFLSTLTFCLTVSIWVQTSL